MTDAERIADAKRWTENDYGLPPRVAKDLVALATELEAKLAEVEAKSESRLRALTGQRESFERTRPLCSGCVDKQSGRGCIACERDRAEAKLAEAERYGRTENERWAKLVAALAADAETREKALLSEAVAALAPLVEHPEWVARLHPATCRCRWCMARQWLSNIRAALAAGEETDREGGAHGSHV